MIHQRLDLEEIRASHPYPLDKKDADGRLTSAYTNTTPLELAMNMQVRDEVLKLIPPTRTVSADIFLWSPGEPPHPAGTKISGVPYLPRGVPWPERRGSPMTFMAQICFADSRDLIGKTPGDVLLLFIGPQAGSYPCSPGVPDAVWHYWVKVDESTVIGPEDVPAGSERFAPCFGSVVRVEEMPELIDTVYEGDNGIDDPDDPPVMYWEDTAILDAMKIGGCPCEVQGPPRLPGRYICNVGTGPSELDGATIERPRKLIIGDMGAMTISLLDDASIAWEVDCH